MYGSANKDKGFDCSGFVWYVFSHFNIKVPRTTVEYTNAGKKIKPKKSKRGDIILFTGSDSKSGVVGHMGIVTKCNKKSFQFIGLILYKNILKRIVHSLEDFKK